MSLSREMRSCVVPVETGGLASRGEYVRCAPPVWAVPVTSSTPPSPRQRQILDYIKAYVAARGFPPTLREIGAKFRIASTNGVREHLLALSKRGLVEVEPHKSRGIRIVPRGGC